MTIKDTMFGHLPKVLGTHFNATLSNEICSSIERRFQGMLFDADHRNNAQIRRHMQMTLLPGIAIYLILLDFVLDRKKAISSTEPERLLRGIVAAIFIFTMVQDRS